MNQSDKPHILVVDDDSGLRRVLQRFLKGNGFAVTLASSAVEAEKLLAQESYSLMVLDIMMPTESGIDFLARIRGKQTLPVLLYSALDKSDMRLAGLKLGADDYLVKSAPPEELILRIRAILRRTETGGSLAAGETTPTSQAVPQAAPQAPESTTSGAIKLAGFSFDPKLGRLTRGKETHTLSESHARLLALLYAAPGQTMRREELAEVLAQAVGEKLQKRSVDAQISRLRHSLNEIDPALAKCLQTLRRRGYRLLPDEAV